MLILWNLVLLFFFIYYIHETGAIRSSLITNVILTLICALTLGISLLFSKLFIGWAFVTLIMVLFNLFYDDMPFATQYPRILTFGVLIFLIHILDALGIHTEYPLIMEILFLAALLIFSKVRNYSNTFTNLAITLIYLLIIGLTYYLQQDMIHIFIFFLGLGIFILLEVTLRTYHKSYKVSTSRFQENLMQHQYEEIKNIYLNMRGWRHDYHNHLQAIKAYLALNQLEQVQSYLLNLEKDLDRIDTYVKSGNLMIDAILNSKISIAEKHNIAVTCKASVTEEIIITEIDLCIILGNLLDNAIESCSKLQNEQRFIRIYITILKKQLYISIQNSAKENLNFEEKNYISTKRGNHGLGMKRVKSVVDKYNGFLNLQNEPGIFASEVTIPLL